MLAKDALETCNEYGDWVVDHRQQLPSQFNVDGARDAVHRHLSISSGGHFRL